MSIERVMHTAISTSDLDRAVEFWAHLGFSEVKRWDWPAGVEVINRFLGVEDSAARAALLEGHGSGIELFEFAVPEQRGVDDRSVHRPGFTHVCFQVDDLDAELARLEAVGLTTSGPPTDTPDGRRMIYGQDPDGNTIELVQLPDQGGGEGDS